MGRLSFLLLNVSKQGLLGWRPARWRDQINYSRSAGTRDQTGLKAKWVVVQGPGIRRSLVNHYFLGPTSLCARQVLMEKTLSLTNLT